MEHEDDDYDKDGVEMEKKRDPDAELKVLMGLRPQVQELARLRLLRILPKNSVCYPRR